MQIVTKQCTKCKEHKELEQFPTNKGGKHGKAGQCKQCKNTKAKVHYTKNRERILEYKTQYWKDNKTRIQRYKEEYSREINNKIRKAIRRRIQNLDQTPAIKPIDSLGCDWVSFLYYIESLFLKGMDWSNYGRGNNKWNLDHVVALNHFDLNNPEQCKRAFHYSNLQPLWHDDNANKGDNPIVERYSLLAR